MKQAITALLSTMVVADTLIWEDNFDKLDFNKWQHEITMGGGGNWEFEVYRNNRTNSFVKDSTLFLKPTTTADALTEESMMYGDYNIWGSNPADQCTSNAFWGCERNAAASGNWINPIMSSRLRTVNSFSTTYGRVEITAQLPKGDMIWPAIWMLPKNNEFGNWPASGEIDIVESRGSDGATCAAGGNDAFASTLHWGPNWDSDAYIQTSTQYVHHESLADAMHVYGLIWTEDRLTTYIDSPENVVLDVDMSTQSFWEKGGWTGFNPWNGEANNAPFNREFYLILNVAVGGTNGYFPDGDCGKTYTDNDPRAPNTFWSTKDTWMPTWNPDSNDSAMKVDSIKVWSLDEDSVFLQ